MLIDVKLLEQVSLFKGLDDEDLRALALRMTECRMPAGAMVFAKGDPGRSMYVLLSGRASIFLPGDGAREPPSPLAELQPGDFFGEMALLDDEPRLASVRVTQEAVLAELTREHLVAFLHESARAVVVMLAEMSRRLRSTTELLGSHASRDVSRDVEKSLSWGQRLADRIAQWNGSWVFIVLLSGLSGLWIALNGALPAPFDAYPYPFFNLFLGILVALQGPLIIMSQNRQALKDRLRSETDFRVNLKNEIGIEQVLRELAKLKAELRHQDAGTRRETPNGEGAET